MPASIIIGGQYGSEGKGKAALFWAKKTKAEIAVRVGGPNSGHTAYRGDGWPFKLRQLPTAALLPNCICIIPAGAYINVPVLLKEIREVGLEDHRLIIDPNACIIEACDILAEKDGGLRGSIASTLSGTGSAVARRVMRKDDTVLAKNIGSLEQYVRETKPLMRMVLDRKKHIVIESTQGYGLSNLHAKDYPFATARDTTAASALSEAGLSPFDVVHVVMVLRAFPIRVAGHSGPLPDEIDWETVTRESGSAEPIIERTTVTNKIRRVGRFNMIPAVEAIYVNKPDIIMLNHVDYFDYRNTGKNALTQAQKDAVNGIESMIGRRIDYVGNGPDIFIKIK